MSEEAYAEAIKRVARPPARGRSKIPKLPAVHTLQVPKDSQNAVRIVSGELSRAKAELDRLHSAYTELRAFAEKQQVEIIALRKRVAGAPSVCPECNALLPSFLDSPALLTQQRLAAKELHREHRRRAHPAGQRRRRTLQRLGQSHAHGVDSFTTHLRYSSEPPSTGSSTTSGTS